MGEISKIMHVYSSAPPRLRRPELHNAMAILPPNTPFQKLTPSLWPFRHVMNSPQVNKAPTIGWDVVDSK